MDDARDVKIVLSPYISMDSEAPIPLGVKEVGGYVIVRVLLAELGRSSEKLEKPDGPPDGIPSRLTHSIAVRASQGYSGQSVATCGLSRRPAYAKQGTQIYNSCIGSSLNIPAGKVLEGTLSPSRFLVENIKHPISDGGIVVGN